MMIATLSKLDKPFRTFYSYFRFIWLIAQMLAVPYPWFLAAATVFFINIATVIGPTPPGTGVIALTF